MAKTGLEKYREARAKAAKAGIDLSDRPNLVELERRLKAARPKRASKKKTARKKKSTPARSGNSGGGGLQRYRDLKNEAQSLGVRVDDNPKLVTLERRVRAARGGDAVGSSTPKRSSTWGRMSEQMLHARISERVRQRRRRR